MMQLNHLDIADQLEQTPKSLRQLLNNINDELAQLKATENSWCVNEVIGHLIWADKYAFSDRISLMTQHDNSHLPQLDVNAAVKARQDHLKPLDSVLDEFESIRSRNVAFIRRLDAATLRNSASYKDRVWLASDFLFEWPFHDYGHIIQVMKILRGSLVPYMSETMRKAVGY